MSRVVLIGVSHWHLNLYLPTLREIGDVTIVGVSDPDPVVARAVGEELGCPWSDSYVELCASTTPDFALALGRHVDMFAEAGFLIEHSIPFAMEKPCGLDLGEVAELARRCTEARHFAAVPFVWRQSELLREMRARFDDSSVRYMSLRWIAGPPSRYVDSGCEWMLDPSQAGGGCTINLSVHLLDLARVVLGTTPRVVAAVMSNAAYGLPIEDYSLIVLQSGARTVVVETGYLVPGPHSKFDMHFSIKADDCYLMATGPEDVELVRPEGTREHVRAFTTNVPHYPLFVRETLQRVASGRPPVASMSDMAEVMELVEAAYELGGLRAGLSTS